MESLFDQIKGHLLESSEAGKYGTTESFKAGFPVVYGSADILKRLMRTGVLLFSSFRMEADSWWMSISKPKHLRC